MHHANLKTLFRVLPVKLYNKEKYVQILAFIDEGSSTTLIDSEILPLIGVKGENVPLCLKWTGDVCRTEHDSIKITGLKISGAHSSKRFNLLSVRSVSKLDLPSQELSSNEIMEYSHTSKLPILPYSKSQPKLLIGLNNAHIGTVMKISEGRLNEPIAVKTRIGWTLYGPSKFGSADSFNAQICEGDLHSLVKEHFSLESIGVVKSEKVAMPLSEKRALEILERFTVRKGDRFESALLWRYPKAVLPDSLPMARRRFQCLERRFLKDPQLKVSMQAQIDDYMRKGYIRQLSPLELKEKVKKCWYLPIFPVINPNKPGKIRIVWDAAAQIKGISLNSLLVKGPVQMTLLIGVLFRFRGYEFAVSGDIEQMFHRIMMRKEDQDCQRFLWRSDSNKELNIYRMNVLTFGASCSPSTAQYVKNKNAEEFARSYPQAADAIKTNHYVDDYLDSFPSLEVAKKISHEVYFIHSKAGFHLRNWLSNSTEVIDELEGHSPNIKKGISANSESIDKVLGMWWCTNSDSFTYTFHLNQDVLSCQHPTKREILRTLMRVFDPMGLISHVLVFAKVLLKNIWRSGVHWDQPITNDHFENWLRWVM